MTLKILWALVTSLPEIIRLLQELERQIDEAKTDQTIADGVRTIHEAFAAKDPALLDALFDS